MNELENHLALDERCWRCGSPMDDFNPCAGCTECNPSRQETSAITSKRTRATPKGWRITRDGDLIRIDTPNDDHAIINRAKASGLVGYHPYTLLFDLCSAILQEQEP